MKKEIRDNYRIEVTPAGSDGFHTRDDEHDARILLDIVQAAVRIHYGNGAARLRFDTRHECSHCGYRWEVLTAELAVSDPEFGSPDEVGLPLCCEAAQAEFRAERAGAGEAP